MKSNEEIQRAVMQELEWDSRIDHTAIGVGVHNGVVTLSGTTTSWSERVAAEKAAHRVAGVLDVANEIHVSVPGERTHSDADIAASVRLALEWNALVPHGMIHSTVTDGRVALEGEVACLRERDDAERAVEHLTGVRAVANKIVVKPRDTPRGVDILRTIEAALERRATRESRRIHVKNEDGIVTLSGTCSTWAEKKAIVGAARGTPGVRGVHDELSISP